MRNNVEIMGRIVKFTGTDQNKNYWLRIASRSNFALKNFDGTYIVKDNHRIYPPDTFINVVVAHHRVEHVNTLKVGELCLFEGIISSDDNGNSVVLIHDIYANVYFKGDNEK